MIALFSFEFSSAHFYHQKKWSAEKNRTVFGKCFSEYGHGHNYRLELEIDIGPHPATNTKNLISQSVQPTLDLIDHEHLSFKIPQFKDQIPTTENISLYLRDQIVIPPPFKLKLLRLFEMDSIFVELNV